MKYEDVGTTYVEKEKSKIYASHYSTMYYQSIS